MLLNIIIREPPTCTGNEPALDIHLGGCGQDIKIQSNKYMSFVMNILIMYHVHHLSTEIEGKNLTKVPKSTPKIANQASPII